ncbi:MAG: LemA family protein [Caulobacteraceae bacterium]
MGLAAIVAGPFWEHRLVNLIRRFSRAALLLVAPLALAGCGINAIPSKEETAKAKWADVQAQYQRRADLIPNLVSTVKGYAAQERNVLVEVIQARASATAVKVDASTVTDPARFQQYANAQNQLSGVLGRLMLIQERYPDLKSNTNFLALQSQLEGTENRIAVSRRDYNDAVRDYNTTLRVFPTVIWAKTMYGSSKPMQLFEGSAAAQNAPTVSFDTTPPASAQPGARPPEPLPAPASATPAPVTQ